MIEGREGGAGKVNIVVSDGGFEIGKDAQGAHLENIQELLSIRCILAECFIALSVLHPGGNFVCKLFDTFSDATVSILFVFCHLFDRVAIVKPYRSRIVNSERYLVAKGLKSRDSAAFQRALALFEHVHAINSDADVYETLVPVEEMLRDAAFCASIREMNDQLVDKQIEGLKLVMDEVRDRSHVHHMMT